MDPMTEFLAGPQARQAFTLRVALNPPFAIDVRDRAALTVIVPVRGTAWVAAGGETQSVNPGEAATVRGPDRYLVADSPDRSPTVVIGPDQSCQTPSGDHVEVTMRHGVRTWGDREDAETVMLIGTYQSDAAVGRLVTAALPRLVAFTTEEVDPALLEMLHRELTLQGLGQQTALDRVLDLLLLHLVRAWAARPGTAVPGWVSGNRDPIVAEALSLLHREPAAPWTVAELGRRVHVSRATLAARFRSSVGQPPMTYLAAWRLALAADRLSTSADTLAVIAARVGYSNAFTFSTAFTRAYGSSPSAYRASQRGGVQPGPHRPAGQVG
ncbi:AraC family transcriptional regulator [Arthrobacter oryzae]|uniref:AraC family transcriptional regulator n=1 Tax=Arthrobacter oryzae TaxID=409290 RepID=UPI00273AA0C6|nr:AraC family transcriptional regulator [Arthrobacter oryzae]WLQ08327.1 AraC family transcriptional regulator [Arthrobacter oryzae]